MFAFIILTTFILALTHLLFTWRDSSIETLYFNRLEGDEFSDPSIPPETPQEPVRAREVWGGYYEGEIQWLISLPNGREIHSLPPNYPVLYIKADVWCQEEYSPAIAVGWEYEERVTSWAKISDKEINCDSSGEITTVSSSYPKTQS